MPVLVIQDVTATGVHVEVTVTVQSHSGSNEATNRKRPSGECWLTESVSVIDNILVHVGHILPK